MNSADQQPGAAPNFELAETGPVWHAYLQRVAALTRPLAEPQRRDIAAEVRAHLLESMLDSQGSECERLRDAQRRLGEPEEFVPGWVEERLSQSADPTLALRSRWQLLRLNLSRGLGGLLHSLLIGFGHMLVFYSYSMVLLKFIYPDNVGLYQLPNGIPLVGFAEGDELTELLGWWLIPVLLVLGTVLLWLMNRPRQRPS